MRVRSAGLALLGAAALTGCGGVSASVKDLGQDASQVCRQTNQTFADLDGPTSQTGAAAYLTTGAGRLDPELRRLRQITPPRDVSDIYQSALSALGQELTALRGAAAEIRQGTDPGMAYRSLRGQLSPLESQANDAWQALQVAACLQ